MTVKAILWKHYVKKNGTCAVKMYVTQSSQELYMNLEFSVNPEDWDDKGLVRRSHPLSVAMNGIIKKKRLEIEQRLLDGATLDDLSRKEPAGGGGGSLLKFAEQYIDEVQRGLHDIRLSTCKNYEYCLARLKGYAAHKGMDNIAFEDIDLDFYFGFSAYLQEFHRCNKPGIGKHVKNLKKFMNESAARGLHQNLKHKNPVFRVHKQRISNKIWLNEEDVARLEALDLAAQPALERERDRWLLSFYLVMSYADSIKIRPEMCFEKNESRFLRYQRQKSGAEAILPIKPKAWELMQKHGFRFNGDTNQEANRKLKIIGAMAGLIELVSEGDRTGPKCSFLATHTARRSAATQMCLQGVSLKVIADLGGWKRIETLKLYLLSSGLDTAEMAKDLPFFK